MPCMCKYDSDNGELASPNCSFFFFVSPFFNLCIDTGRDRSGCIEEARALGVVGAVDEAPNGPEDDEIERQRQGKHQQT